MKASACSSLPGSLLNGPLHSEWEWQREIGSDRDRTWKREGAREGGREAAELRPRRWIPSCGGYGPRGHSWRSGVLVWAEGRSACPRGISFCGIKGGYSSPIVSFNLPPPYIWDQRCRDEAPRLLSSPDRAQQLLTHTNMFPPLHYFKRSWLTGKKKKKAKSWRSAGGEPVLFPSLLPSSPGQAGRLYLIKPPWDRDNTRKGILHSQS